MRGDPTPWILARSSGLAAYLFLVTSVVVGTTVKSRPLGRLVKPSISTDLHRFVALMAIAAVGLHGVALLFDTTIRITPLDLVLPGRLPYRPLWTGTGVVAAELMLVVYLSFSVKRWIGARMWRRLHWLTYPLLALASAHGFMAGSDTPHAWTRYVYVGTFALAAFAISLRVLITAAASKRSRIAAGTT